MDSCKEHNEATSTDDEYVRNVITMLMGNNDTSYTQFSKRTINSLSKSSALLKMTTEKQKAVKVGEVETIALAIDRDRVDSVMKKIAYAIFYYKYKQRWNRKLVVSTTGLKTESLENDEFGDLIKKIQDEHDPVYEGCNPKVFQYAFMPTNESSNNSILRMKFYEGIEFWMIPDIESQPDLN